MTADAIDRPTIDPVPRRITFALATLCCLAAFVPSQAIADDATGRWQWDATVYLWLPTMGGDTSFPPDGGGPAIDVSADQILDSLESVFMVAVDGRRGPWGVSTDVVYLDLGASKKATRDFGIGRVDLPASVTADLSLDITGWLWTLYGTYAVVDEDAYSLRVLAGTRMLDLEETLDWTFNGDVPSLPVTERSGSGGAKDTQWDAIIGLKGRATFGEARHWYVPYYVDVGTGESDFTWQAMAGLGYSFDSVAVMGVWRYLDYDLGDDTPVKSIEFNGPALGVQFRF